MASNDPSDTGGLFIGRRPGTAPVRIRPGAVRGSKRRQRGDRVLANGILVLEALLCLSLFGPQPLVWFWVGSQVQYITGYVTAGISTILLGCLASLMLTMVLAKRLDHAWKLVRRAGGHDQERGALEIIFAVCVAVTVIVFGIWFFLIEGPGPSLAPTN
jgi:hypothetical protein